MSPASGASWQNLTGSTTRFFKKSVGEFRSSVPHLYSYERVIWLLKQIDALYDLANQVQATMIMMFLHGLRSFLMVAAYRSNSTAAQRLESIEARIHALIPMTEQWSNIGRVERSAISEILAV
jgi:hypothetical protein